MISRTHDLAAFATLVTYASAAPITSLNLATFGLCLIGNIVGSLIPDMDQASNRLWDLLPGGNYVGKVLKKLFLSHRTLSHSILGIYLIYLLLQWLLPKILNPGYINIQFVLVSVLLGLVSHIFLDFLTEEGVPLLFPIKWKIGFPPIASWRIKTGGWFEKYVVFPSILVYLVWFVGKNQGAVVETLKLIVK